MKLSIAPPKTAMLRNLMKVFNYQKKEGVSYFIYNFTLYQLSSKAMTVLL